MRTRDFYTRKIKEIICILLLAIPATIIAQSPLKEGLNQARVRIASGTDLSETNALIWLPRAYNPTRKYPLVIYGHGTGQAGANIDLLYTDGLPAVLKEGFQPPFDCIILCPQRDSYGVLPQWLPGILEDARRRFNIDTTRIYLTGTSAGGYLCYGSQLNVSGDLAQKFAAICVLSGATQDANQDNLNWWVKSRTPLWAIVGSEDPTFKRQNILLVHAINEVAPGVARISMRAGIGHGGWKEVYNGTFSENGQNIWDWLYQFKTGPAGSGRHAATNRRINLMARDRQVYCPDVTGTYHPQPGDTLVVPTGILSFLLRNFTGDNKKPILIIPADSGWIGGYAAYGAVISNAKYFKLTGFHIDGHKSSELGMAIASQTSDYEISHCRIKNTAAIGLCAKQDPDSSFPGGSFPGFSIRNVVLHDIATQNTGTEGFYIGYTFDVIKPLASPLVNLTIYNVTVDSAGWDGLQLSNCQQVKLHDVSIRHYGLKDQSSQQAGLLLGGMVTLQGAAYNVRVTDGTGPGLLIFGRGQMKFNRMILSKTGLTPGQNAIFVNDYKDLGYGLPPLQLLISDTRVNGSAGGALVVFNGNKSMKPGRIENFSFSGTRSGIRDDLDSLVKSGIRQQSK
jgi:poly(3-hydroxybutyrate) depolymerase